MKKYWWKIAAIVFVLYAIIAGLLGQVPRQPILNESIRNLYFHVTIWFGMMMVLIASLVYSIKYLAGFDINNDLYASESAGVAVFMGILGIATGSVWAKFTWGAWWVSDAKLNGVAIAMLFYMAYFVLRNSMEDDQKRARVSAIYNIFAFVMLVVFIWILPRMVDSLHPGNGGNPGFGKYDLDSKMRWVFYPAIIGWTLLALWILDLRIRIKKIEEQIDTIE